MKESIEKKVEFLKKNKEFGIVRTNGYLCLSDDENLRCLFKKKNKKPFTRYG